MALIALGLNHKTAPLEIRERLTFGPDIVVGALRSLLQRPGVEEAVILSTCNRTEVYCATGPAGASRSSTEGRRSAGSSSHRMVSTR